MTTTIQSLEEINGYLRNFANLLTQVSIYAGVEGVQPFVSNFFDYDVVDGQVFVTFNIHAVDDLKKAFGESSFKAVAGSADEIQLVGHTLTGKVYMDECEIAFDIPDPVFNVVSGLMYFNTPAEIHQHSRRSSERVTPSIAEAPEIVILTDGETVEVPVLDISPDGVRIMLPGFQWHKVVSPTSMNKCLIRIPGGREYYADLEVRHKKLSVEDRLDSPIEIGCKFHGLNNQGKQALNKFCKKIIVKNQE